jgi:hypothetical protein
MRLTDQHIDYISTNLELYGLKNKDLKEDILDHICIHIEKAEEGNFDKAYKTAIQKFGGYSYINRIQTETNFQLYFKSVKNLNRILFTIELLASMLIITGSLFKIMHWPYAGWIIFLGFVLLIVIALPLYFYSKYKEKLLKYQS